MHQHPRSPLPSRQANQRALGLARDDVPRDQDDDQPPSRTTLDATRGLGIEPGLDTAAPAKEAILRLNQIISNYHTKAALIILRARADLPPLFSKGSDKPKVNRWFNIDIDETDEYREDIRRWKTCDAIDNRPPPLIIETFLDARPLTNSQTLVLIDENGKRWDVLEALAASQDPLVKARPKEVVLERWRIELGESSTKPPSDLGAILPAVYKKSIVLFRSLHAYAKFLPVWKIIKRPGIMRNNPVLNIRYRIREARDEDRLPNFDNLTIPLQTGNEKVVDTYSFGSTESPAGPFSIQVTYRRNVDFRVDDSEALLSSRFMGADDTYFLPSLPSEEANKLPAQGSLPVSGRGLEQPDRTQAYGSLSTFHQVGPTTGASPISTLRAARDLGSTSPSSTSSPPRLLPAAKVGQIGRTAALANESSLSIARRPSVSFHPFKAPPLSASPSLVDPPLGSSLRTSASRTITAPSSLNDPKAMPPPAVPASAARTPASEQVVSSASSSPRPAPISKYSSSFSHRRGRLSSGGNIRLDEDNTSSGKASATSSNAQPGSGILTEPAGTSAESLHTDDENISDFLKLLDLKKDLLNPVKAAAVDAATRRTSAALTRFQKMRESNAALSESMSSSLLMQRSSTSSSRQLSSIPPMVAGTSISTASSPGKPISPHTPHTPAIPSRLSSNSIISYDRERDSPLRQATVEQDSHPEECTSYETAQRPSRPGAIDIPKSPRPLGPSYRRSNSVAQNRRISAGAGDEEEIFPFAMRSVSLGAEERSNLSLSTRLRQQDTADVGDAAGPQSSESAPQSDEGVNNALPLRSPFREIGPQSGGFASGASSSNHPYQTHSSHSRGRGSSTGLQSHSSASGSLSRGNAIPPHLAERERDRDTSASGSNSGNSVIDVRRGAAPRSGPGRSGPQHGLNSEEDEPLLFAMSDFHSSRRSLEEGRRGSVGGESSATSGGSRRGSGRRGTGMPSFHPWQQ